MSKFSVDTATLEALQAQIGGLYKELSEMHQIAAAFTGQLGGRDLEDEIGHFLSAWHSGVELIAGDMKKVSDRLGAAAAAYGQSETFITAASCG